MGMIGRPTGPLMKTSTNGPLGIILSTPLRFPREIEHKGPSRVALPEPRPPSRLEFSPQSIPSRIQGATTDADGPADTGGSIIRRRYRVPKRWYLLDVNGDHTQEGQVSDDWQSRLMYHRMYI